MMLKNYDFDNIPVVDLVNTIILDSIKEKASDIHFDPTPTILKVRIRIDGELVDFVDVPEAVKKNLSTRIKIIAGMNITESRLPQDGAVKSTVDDVTFDLRVSTLPIVNGEKIVVRILDYTMSMQGLETLGFSPRNLEKVLKMVSAPNGIILTTGATGSGKSTTNYSILQRLNVPEKNIITVEDPVEMKLSGINQVQVLSDIGMTFATALRSILRQDPDVIMIGEIRDNETARIAVRASITGHLVLSTIHTNNSLNTIERLLDMDIERYLLGTALTGIISQRLAKKLCPKCREKVTISDYEKAVIKASLNLDINEVYKPVGCSECIKGYRGRIALHEVLLLNQDIRDAIVANVSKRDLRNAVYNSANTITLLQDGLEKVISGMTSFEEVLRLVEIESDFGEDEQDIKNVIMGKTINVPTVNHEKGNYESL